MVYGINPALQMFGNPIMLIVINFLNYEGRIWYYPIYGTIPPLQMFGKPIMLISY